MTTATLREPLINWLHGRIALSRARSLLAYLLDMSRRSLRGSSHFIPLTGVNQRFPSFDTLKFTKRLILGGFTVQQAEAEAEALADVLQAGGADLATQRDIDDLRKEMNSKFTLLQWMIGSLIVLAVANFAKQFF